MIPGATAASTLTATRAQAMTSGTRRRLRTGRLVQRRSRRVRVLA